MTASGTTTTFPFNLGDGCLVIIFMLHGFSGLTYGQSPIDSLWNDGWHDGALESLHDQLNLESIESEDALRVQYHLLQAEILLESLDLNTCSIAELSAHPLIGPLLAADIIALRKAQGGFQNLIDLLQLQSFTPEVLDRLRPFVTLTTPSPAEDSTTNGKASSQGLSSRPPRERTMSWLQSMHRRIDLPRGFQKHRNDGGFSGSPVGLFARLAARPASHIGFYLALEKDPGEPIAWNPTEHMYAFDHISSAIEIARVAFLKNIILGDYLVSWGQGLLFSNPYGPRKGANPTSTPIRKRSRIRPSVSRAEGYALRGASFELPVSKRISAQGFYSNRLVDASLGSSGASSEAPATSNDLVLSVSASGLHRSETEKQRRLALRETVYGAFVEWAAERYEGGLGAYKSAFSHSFFPGNQLWDRFDFAGRYLAGASIYGSAAFDQTFLFGEWARSFPGHSAYLVGLLMNPNRQLRLLLLWRRYEPAYHTMHGQAFGERSSAPRNETGFYFGMEFQATPAWSWSLFVDAYQFDWPTAPMARPGNGQEVFTRVVFAPRPWIETYLQYRFEVKEASYIHAPSFIQLLKTTAPRERHALRCQLDYEFSSHFMSRSRIELKSASGRTKQYGIKQYGIALYQQIVFTLRQDVRMYFGTIAFDAQGNDVTLYIYEPDLTYRFSVRPHGGRGFRNFVLLKWYLTKNLRIEAKYGATRYGEVVHRGSGSDAYSGDRIREVHAQIHWQF